MSTRSVSLSDARAPFYVRRWIPVFDGRDSMVGQRGIVDHTFGARVERDQRIFFETYSGAQYRAHRLAVDPEVSTVIEDATGREVCAPSTVHAPPTFGPDEIPF